MFYPVAVSEKSNFDRYAADDTTVQAQADLLSSSKQVDKEDDSSFIIEDLNKEPSFFKNLAATTSEPNQDLKKPIESGKPVF